MVEVWKMSVVVDSLVGLMIRESDSWMVEDEGGRERGFGKCGSGFIL